jgi:2'-5' RNA ligase
VALTLDGTMNEPTPRQPRARLFAALDLPDEVRSELARWGARELADPALRPVATENLHVTMCFLGSTDESRVGEASAIVEGVAPRPVPLRLAPAPVAKPRGRPALYALDADSEAAVELQTELAAAFASAGLYEPERRPFWPHVTVARVRTERGRRRRPQRVERAPGELLQSLVHTFDSVRLRLYRSNLRPEGAKYSPLASLDLPPAPSRDRRGRGEKEDG